MLHQYKTLRQLGQDEVVIKKSRFIGHAKPVHSEEEAIRFIEGIKKEHASATHNTAAESRYIEHAELPPRLF